MRTALITVGDKQQVVLQPENLREHRVLQMLTEGNKDIQVMESELEVTEHGSLSPKPTDQWHQQHKDRPKPVMIQVQPDIPMRVQPPERNPDVLVMTKGELEAILRMMHAKNMSRDPFDPEFGAEILERAQQEKGRLLAALDELRAMAGNYREPSPYL
jgi:hypothetical protein